jgi:hypothetical protein
MDITSETRTFNQLMPISGNDCYYIPLYQRQYSWREENIRQLFDDIQEENESYYVGNLLVIPHDSNNANSANADSASYDVIDGQQRLTTLSLFLLAIWQRLGAIRKASDDSDNDVTLPSRDIEMIGTIRSDIKRRLIDEDTGEPRLRLLQSDDAIYRQHLEILNDRHPSIDKRKMFSKRYKYILDDLLTQDELQDVAGIKKFYDKLEKITILRIHVPNLADAFNVFSSMNSKGLPLTLVDLLKAEFIANAERYISASQTDTTNTWCKLSGIFSKDGEPDTTLTTQFLLNNWDAMESTENKAITKGSALDSYRTRIAQMYKDRKDYLATLVDRAESFAQILGLDGHTHPDAEVAARCRALGELESTQAYPLLLELFWDKQLEVDDQLPAILDYLIAFYVRRNITLVPKASNIRARMIRLAHLIRRGTWKGEQILPIIKNGTDEAEGLNDIAASDQQLRDALCTDGIYDKNAKTTRFVLIDLERKLPGKSFFSKGTPDSLDKYDGKHPIWSIEHILPEGTLPEIWREDISPDYPSHADELQQQYVHLIGNLTLTPYNSEWSQRPFPEKVSYVDKGTQQVAGLSMPLKINTALVDAEHGETLKTKKRWTVDDITRRSAWFADQILKIYALQ